MGVVRIAGVNKQNEIEKDFQNTLKTWESKKSFRSYCSIIVYEEGDIIKRTIRDLYDNETKNIYVEGNEAIKKQKVYERIDA